MPVTVVVGGQFGSEGKGKICAHLAVTDNVDYMVRCGGPNSGHTVYSAGKKYELKQVPTGFINPNTRLLIAPGGLVKPSLFLEEAQLCGLDPQRIGIDRNAGIIEDSDVVAEASLDLRGRLGSTGVGMGSAVSRRVLREPTFRQAKDHPDLAPYITSVQDELKIALRSDKRVIVEGTQGYGLSLYHAHLWPYRTSRDTTAHSFLGEVGIGVRDFNVVMAIRTFPIRVAGQSGPLPDEIHWEDVQKISGYPYPVDEYTTTTKRLRRVAKFNWGIVEEAVLANAPSAIALHGADYLDFRNKGVTRFADLTSEAQKFIEELEQRLGVPVAFIGTGPANEEVIDRRDISKTPMAHVTRSFSFAR